MQEHGWQLGQMRLWPVRVILREYAYHGLAKNQSIWEFIDTQLKSKDIDLPGCSQLIKRSPGKKRAD
ncbi:MAG: hypothetical protein M5U34_12510 [Chloroflexi bacterium]|nr:hypothetical protein [Chloroflexota bacterium]